MTTRRDTLTGVVLDERLELTLVELSEACAVRTEWIVTLVEEGVLMPVGAEPESWRFTGEALCTARAVSRLERDLGVNLPGAALALELIAELDALRARLAALEGDD